MLKFLLVLTESWKIVNWSLARIFVSQPARLNFRDILLEINIDRKYSSLDLSHAQRRFVDVFETCIRVYFGKAHLEVALFSSAVVWVDGNKVQSWKSDTKQKDFYLQEFKEFWSDTDGTEMSVSLEERHLTQYPLIQFCHSIIKFFENFRSIRLRIELEKV